MSNYERVGSKEQTKVEKCQNLKQEIATLWGMGKVQVILIGIVVLDMISYNLEP